MNNYSKTLSLVMLVAPAIISGRLTTADNTKIAYRHYKNGHRNVIIIAPGFYNSKDAALLQRFKDKLIDAYDVIMFDFRGHGRSSGLFYWTSKEGLDLQAVSDYAGKEYEKIGLIAFSLGAATAINFIAESDAIKSLVAISAPSDPNKIDYRFWKLSIKGDLLYTFGKEGKIGRGVRPGPFWFKKARPIDLVDKIICPVFYIHGDKDWVIDYQNSKKLYNKTASKKQIQIVKEGTHAEYLLKDDAQDIIGLIKSWFAATITKGEEK